MTDWPVFNYHPRLQAYTCESPEYPFCADLIRASTPLPGRSKAWMAGSSQVKPGQDEVSRLTSAG
jgi:hypothetical protein